jgi:hypothetical protein
MEMTDSYMEQRLEAWAYWFTKNIDGLGYPGISIEYRIWKEGTVNQPTGPKTPQSNPDAEEIEECFIELNKTNGKLARILRDAYLQPHKTVSQIARKNSLSNRRFHELVKQAKELLKVFLIAKIKYQKESFKKAA